MQEVDVQRRDAFRYVVHATDVGQALQWCFSTRKNSIGFGLFFKKSSYTSNQGQPYDNLFVNNRVGRGSQSNGNSTTPANGLKTATSSQSLTQIEEQLNAIFHAALDDGWPRLEIEPAPKQSSSSAPSASSPSHSSAAPSNLNSPLPPLVLPSKSKIGVPLSQVSPLKKPVLNRPGRAASEAATLGRPSISLLQSNFSSNDLVPDVDVEQRRRRATEAMTVMLDKNVGSSSSSASPVIHNQVNAASFDADLLEILPIERYESNKTTVCGKYIIPIVGTYVLLWDNTFSRNTSKHLSFTVSLTGATQHVKEPQPDKSGWILKKKKKVMQGWAKRWFQVEGGIMSYYLSPESFCRGTMNLLTCAISANPSALSMTLDSGDDIYHLKYLNEIDFRQWSDIIAKYKASQRAASYSTPGTTLHAAEMEDQVDENEQTTLELPTIDLTVSHNYQTVPLSKTINRFHEELDSGILNSANQTKQLKLILESAKNITAPAELERLADGLESMVTGIGRELMEAQGALEKLGEFHREYLRRQSEYRSAVESVYLKSMADLNRIRRHTDNNAKNISSLSSHRTRSIASSQALTDEFFDANEIIVVDDPTDTAYHGPIDSSPTTSTDSDESNSEPETEMSQPPNERNESLKVAMSSLALSGSQRRRVLPAPMSTEGVSMLSLLRKSMGRDVGSMSMPVTVNEPLSALQRMCEELEYSYLLDTASKQEDPLMRLVYVTAFAISGFASSAYRVMKKPFNPLLGETFEAYRPDRGFRYISEKVVHNPLLIACHAESIDGAYVFAQDQAVRSRFYGKSIEYVPEGVLTVRLPKSGDVFTWKKVMGSLRNIIAGSRYMEYYGTMVITNESTGDQCQVVFKENNGGGFFGSNNAASLKNEVFATIGRPVKYRMRGRWDEALYLERDAAGSQLEVIWQATPPPRSHAEYYGFTQFSIELNELPEEPERSLLPITDSRFRPDQRLLEEGSISEAEAEKLRIEQAQRERRKELEAAGQSWQPQWFCLVDGRYQYKGGYWEARQAKQFKSMNLLELW